MQSKMLKKQPGVQIKVPVQDPDANENLHARVKAAIAQFIKGQYGTSSNSLKEVKRALEHKDKGDEFCAQLKNIIVQFESETIKCKKSELETINLIIDIISDDPEILNSDSESKARFSPDLTTLHAALLDLLVSATEIMLVKSDPDRFKDAGLILGKIETVLTTIKKISLTKQLQSQFDGISHYINELKEAMVKVKNNPDKEQEVMDLILKTDHKAGKPMDASANETISAAVANEPLACPVSAVDKLAKSSRAVTIDPLLMSNAMVVDQLKSLFAKNSGPLEIPLAEASEVLPSFAAKNNGDLLAADPYVVPIEPQASSAYVIATDLLESPAVVASELLPTSAPVAMDRHENAKQSEMPVNVMAVESAPIQRVAAQRQHALNIKEEILSQPIPDKLLKKYEMVYEAMQDNLMTARRQIAMGQFEEAKKTVKQSQANEIYNIDTVGTSSNLADLESKLFVQKFDLLALEAQIASESSEQYNYHMALDDLEACISNEENAVNTLLNSIVSQVKLLQESSECSPQLRIELLNALWSTREFIEGGLNEAGYLAVAATMQRQPIRELQVLGALFVALALLTVVISLVVCPLLLGPAVIAMSAAYAGGCSTGAGVLLGTGISLGFFGTRGRKSEIEQTMQKLTVTDKEEKQQQTDFDQVKSRLAGEIEPNSHELTDEEQLIRVPGLSA